jgi:hypothetical protein
VEGVPIIVYIFLSGRLKILVMVLEGVVDAARAYGIIMHAGDYPLPN